jgi:predicted GNAT family acetyltransferase
MKLLPSAGCNPEDPGSGARLHPGMGSGQSGIVLLMADPTLTIIDRPEARRFEAHLGDELAGFLEYRLAGTRRILIHTEVLPAFGGRGIGAALARHALDEALAAGTRVTPKCPFVRAWLERHPEYAAIVTPEPARRDGA